ncbi:hypothetical protein [Mycobacterium sp. 48b]|uniref:hypothetical protein n=1 Tax=Mycobacterium sp. 48b TaxID=3400426 RepID=UPI003AB09C31
MLVALWGASVVFDEVGALLSVDAAVSPSLSEVPLPSFELDEESPSARARGTGPLTLLITSTAATRHAPVSR